MNFDFTEEQRLLAELVRGFARDHLAAGALKRAHHLRFPYDVAKLMAQQGLMGITLAECDGGQGGTLMDAVIAIEQVAAVCPRSADVVQFGNFGPIRTFAEYGSESQKKRWLGDLLAGRMVMRFRHDRARCRLRGDRSKNQRAAGWVTLHHQRQQGVFHLQPGRADFSHLCALWPRPRRHWIGADRARCARLHHRGAFGVHERRGMVRIAFRRLPHSGRERAARPRWLQEADGRLQC